MSKKILLTLIIMIICLAGTSTVKAMENNSLEQTDIKDPIMIEENQDIENSITGYTDNIKQFNNLKKSISTMSVNATSTSEYEYSALSDGTIEITGYNGTGTAVSIPSAIDGKTVTSIGRTAFYENGNITSVVIPNTVTKIGEGAFTRCTKLTSITIGNKVETIETYAFDETAISTITIPASVKTIGDYIFYDCMNLKTINVASGSTSFASVNGVLFDKNITKLISYPIAKTNTTYTIPSTVTTIGELGFRKCTYLEQINIPNSVTTLENFAFSHLPKLKTITLPSSITTIWSYTFEECSSLTSITANVNVEEFPSYFVNNCDNLEKIDLSNAKIKETNIASFSNCDKLTTVILPDTLEVLSHMTLYRCNTITSLDIPSSVKRVEESFYLYCNNFKNYTIPDGLVEDGNGGYVKAIELTITGSFDYTKAIEVANLTNEQRVANGVEKLTLDEQLTEAAMKRARELSLYYEHTRPVGSGYSSVIPDGREYMGGSGISISGGENIAAVYDSPESVVNGWMNSPGHKGNILQPAFISIGVGCYKSSDGRYYWVQIFDACKPVGTVSPGVTEEETVKEKIFVDFVKRISANLSDYTNTYEIGETFNVKPKLVNEGWNLSTTIAPTDVTFKSSDTSVFTIDKNGLLKAVGPGSATLEIKLLDIVETYKIQVEKPIESISLPATLEMDISETPRLEVKFYPEDTTSDKTIKWSTSSVLVGAAYSIDGCESYIREIQAHNVGTVTITATSSNGKKASCVVTVKSKIKSVKFSGTEYSTYVGNSFPITPTILPQSTTEDKTLTWKSSNPSIATVDSNGKITAISVGTTTISATTKSGVSGSYTLNVLGTNTSTSIPNVSYTTHVQDIGWQDYVSNGDMAGTSGKSLRLEGIKIKISNTNLSGGIKYSTHVQNEGWQDYVSNGMTSGTSGKSLRLEAIKIMLTGELAEKYDVYYRVHAQEFGWLGWAKNGEEAGTSGYSYRLEGIQIKLVAKGGAAPGSTENAFHKSPPRVKYTTHVQNEGWQDFVRDGATSGTMGKSLRLEGIKIELENSIGGGIAYQTHVQEEGWQDWKGNGQTAGTTGKSYRLEAIRIKLTGEMANKYDVYYRVHSQEFGWLGWAKNGASAGTSGYSYRLEGIEIRLVEKGKTGPTSTVEAYKAKNNQ